MWYQKDWFTGSDYYNFRGRQIAVQELGSQIRWSRRFMSGQKSTMSGAGRL